MQVGERTMTTIKHPLYKDFYEKGIISIFPPKEFEKVHKDITDPFGQELVTVLYYTGCRPVQVLSNDPKEPNLSFTTDNITKENNHLKIVIPPAKNGLPFTFYLDMNKYGIKQLWATVQKLPPKTFIFAKYSQSYVRKKTNAKGEVKYYVERSDLMRYYFKKWFGKFSDNPIPPYFLRHSRFSSISENGGSPESIMFAKGSKSMESVRPYMHISKDKAMKLNRNIK